MKDLNEIVKIEKAISEKYGDEAIANPKQYWTEEKEKEYLNQLKDLSAKELNQSKKDQKIEIDGVLISKKLLTKETKRTCPVCSTYSFQLKDDLYMNRFECCHKCYVQWIEGREERWKTGWRPNNENFKK